MISICSCLAGDAGELDAQYAQLEAADTAALGADLKRRRKREAVQGTAVAHQQAVWEHVLEIRILLQKVLTASHRLPPPPGRDCSMEVS